MRILLVLLLAFPSLSVTACGGEVAPQFTGAQRLANADRSTDAAAYQRAIDALSAKCSNPPDNIPNIVQGTLKVLNDGGVHDETNMSVLQNLSDSLPEGAPKMDCVDIGGVYVTLRTNS